MKSIEQRCIGNPEIALHVLAGQRRVTVVDCSRTGSPSIYTMLITGLLEWKGVYFALGTRNLYRLWHQGLQEMNALTLYAILSTPEKDECLHLDNK